MNPDPVLDNRWNPIEVERALYDVGTIQEEINYIQARTSLKNLVEGIDLEEGEKIGLENDLNRLVQLLDKLEEEVVQIAAFGMVGRGKSSVLNALVGREIFRTGPLHGVTKTIDGVNWRLTNDKDHPELQRLTLTESGTARVQLLDTPGIDEVEGEEREKMALSVARQVDLILFVVSGDMTKVEFSALSNLRSAGKPIILVFNKIDQYRDADRLAVYEKIRDERVKELLSPDEIVMVAAHPLIVEAVTDKNGRLQKQTKRGQPLIEDLKLKILEILDREGKSLVALNTMLYADEMNERIVTRKMQIRAAAADSVIRRAVMMKALSIALNPVTVLDLFSGTIIDVAMILTLSKVYGLSMTGTGAIALLKKIALGMGGISASEFLAVLGLGGVKSLLGLSAPVTGGISLAPYLSVAIAQGSVAGVSCYAIGQVTKTYLANGATWGPEGPKAVVSRILDSLDETSILNRIRWELEAKLGSKRHG